MDYVGIYIGTILFNNFINQALPGRTAAKKQSKRYGSPVKMGKNPLPQKSAYQARTWNGNNFPTNWPIHTLFKHSF